MKVVRLTYHREDVEQSVPLLLFLRFVGIYVYERYYGGKIIRQEDVAAIQEAEAAPVPFTAYDCELFLNGKASDWTEYASLIGDQVDKSIILAKAGTDAEADPRDVPNFDGKLASLNALIQAFLNKGIIGAEEMNDLLSLSQIYCDNDIARLTLKTKFFYAQDESEDTQKIVTEYRKIVSLLAAEMSENHCGWGSRRLFYTQYAALNMIYEANCYCFRCKMTLAYKQDMLIPICEAVEAAFEGLLDDSVRLLKGQIYDDLLSEPNKAYEQYVNCCNKRTTYNSFVFYRKGIYWQEFALDYENAVKYYLNAAYIYPEYYRVWFRMGVCLYRLEKYDKAVAALENVRKGLMDRYAANCVRPMEIEYIFKAQNLMGSIWEEKYHNESRAIEAYMWAERIWDCIATSSFYVFMCQAGEADGYRRKTEQSLDINSVYERLAVLYASGEIPDNDRAEEYQKKIRY